MVVPHPRAGSHALLTRAPLSPGASPGTSFDLHVLGLPPAFVLSQDQTLKLSLRPVHFSPGGRNHPGVTDYLHGPLFQKKERPVQASRQRCTETDRFRHPNKDSYPICRDAKNAARASLPLPQCQTARRQNRRNVKSDALTRTGRTWPQRASPGKSRKWRLARRRRKGNRSSYTIFKRPGRQAFCECCRGG